MASDILFDLNVFEVDSRRGWNYILIGTKYAYNNSQYLWFDLEQDQKSPRSKISFEEMFNNIMADFEVTDSVKESILFNLIDLKKLLERGF